MAETCSHTSWYCQWSLQDPNGTKPQMAERKDPWHTQNSKVRLVPKDQKARNKTKPNAKNNSTQALRFLSFQKKISTDFYVLYNFHKPFSTLSTCLTTFYTPSEIFIDLLTHLGITIPHFQSFSFLMMERTILKLSIWQLKVPKSANTFPYINFTFFWLHTHLNLFISWSNIGNK